MKHVSAKDLDRLKRIYSSLRKEDSLYSIGSATPDRSSDTVEIIEKSVEQLTLDVETISDCVVSVSDPLVQEVVSRDFQSIYQLLSNEKHQKSESVGDRWAEYVVLCI
jgi:hypothetical protein